MKQLIKKRLLQKSGNVFGRCTTIVWCAFRCFFGFSPKIYISIFTTPTHKEKPFLSTHIPFLSYTMHAYPTTSFLFCGHLDAKIHHFLKTTSLPELCQQDLFRSTTVTLSPSIIYQ